MHLLAMLATTVKLRLQGVAQGVLRMSTRAIESISSKVESLPPGLLGMSPKFIVVLLVVSGSAPAKLQESMEMARGMAARGAKLPNEAHAQWQATRQPSSSIKKRKRLHL